MRSGSKPCSASCASARLAARRSASVIPSTSHSSWLAWPTPMPRAQPAHAPRGDLALGGRRAASSRARRRGARRRARPRRPSPDRPTSRGRPRRCRRRPDRRPPSTSARCAASGTVPGTRADASTCLGRRARHAALSPARSPADRKRRPRSRPERDARMRSSVSDTSRPTTTSDGRAGLEEGHVKTRPICAGSGGVVATDVGSSRRGASLRVRRAGLRGARSPARRLVPPLPTRSAAL